MLKLTDQVGNLISLERAAQRIVSLVPSQTELLHYFDLHDRVVGITKFCIHPDEWYQTKERIGGTKNLNISKIQEIKPDLIIANKEENTKRQIEFLKKNYQVYISDINTAEDAYQMIRDVGILTAKEQKAVDLIDDIQESFDEMVKLKGSVLYFIWKDPYMVCGTDNFIHSIINEIGLTNVITQRRYIEISKEQIQKLKPDYIFLSSEPFPFNEEHKRELETISNAKVYIVDGEMFSWYGSRMLKMKTYFKNLEQKVRLQS